MFTSLEPHLGVLFGYSWPLHGPLWHILGLFMDPFGDLAHSPIWQFLICLASYHVGGATLNFGPLVHLAVFHLFGIILFWICTTHHVKTTDRDFRTPGSVLHSDLSLWSIWQFVICLESHFSRPVRVSMWGTKLLIFNLLDRFNTVTWPSGP